MRPIPKSHTGNEAERLLRELKAIEQWDAAYWRNDSPDVYERVAFRSRRCRRSEILSQLLNTLPLLSWNMGLHANGVRWQAKKTTYDPPNAKELTLDEAKQFIKDHVHCTDQEAMELLEMMQERIRFVESDSENSA